MVTLGITGGVASGKSTVTALFEKRGATVFSADDAAYQVVEPGAPALAEIAEAFGAEYLLPEGRLDRARLGAYVFAHPEARLRLEAITHPRILALLRSQIDAARALPDPPEVVAVEVPLLYEAGMEEWFDRVLVVTASEATQIERLRDRNGLSEAEALRRIAAQMPLAEKEARADYVVRNDGELAEVDDQVEAVWRDLRDIEREGAGR